MKTMISMHIIQKIMDQLIVLFRFMLTQTSILPSLANTIQLTLANINICRVLVNLITDVNYFQTISLQNIQLLFLKTVETSILASLWKLGLDYYIFEIQMKEEDERSSIQYQISLSSFKQQVAYKQSVLEKLSQDMSVKISSNEHKKKQGTSQMVQLCRKNIEEIQHIFLDLHAYFIQLKLDFIYDISVEIFKTLVLGFKLLSQRFVALLKNKRKKEDSQPDQNFHRRTDKLIEEAKNKNFTQMQYYDCLIKTIELDEDRLNQKTRQTEKKLFIDKTLIENLNASDAVNQLEVLKRQMDRIIMYSVKITSDTIKNEQMQSKSNTMALTKPDQIENEYCTSIAENTQQIFKKKMGQIAAKFYQSIRQREKQEIIRQISSSKPLQTHREIQTYDLEFKLKQQNSKSADSEGLKKSNIGLRKQLKEMIGKMEKMEGQRDELQEKVKHTVDMLNKKVLELYKAKGQFDFHLGKKDQIIQNLNKKVTQMEITNQKLSEEKNSREPSVLSPEGNGDYNQESFDETLTEDKHQDDTISMKLKFGGNKTHHTSLFYEKQFKATKQQNNHLRRSLSIMLDALKEQKLILEYPINDLNNDLRLGKLISKIEAISIELLNKVKQIRLRDQPKMGDGPHRPSKKRTMVKSQLSLVQTDRRRQSSIKFAVAETQTVETYQQESIYAKEKSKSSRGRNTDKNVHGGQKNVDKLETLKKQLMSKVYLGKRSHATVGISRQKQNLTKAETNKQSTKVGFANLMGIEEMSNSKRISKTKPLFNRKDISFEEFKFSILENKSQDASKRVLVSSKKFINTGAKIPIPKDKRRSNNKSHEFRPAHEEHSQEEQILGVQTHSCLNQVKKTIQTIQTKQDKRDIYLKYFINKLVAELAKIKGSQVVDEIFHMGNDHRIK